MSFSSVCCRLETHGKAECYKTTLCKRKLPNAHGLTNSLCRYALILIESFNLMPFGMEVGYVWKNTDKTKMIFLRLLENNFRRSVRTRASQKQSLVE